MLKNKTILFIAPKFFNYHTHIIFELKEMGANVIFFNEKKNNIIFRILKKTSSKGFSLYNRLYEKKIEKKITNKQIDYLFLIKGEYLSNNFISNIISKNINCKSIYYQWDSFKNNPNGLKIYQHFDRCFSFDMQDCYNVSQFKYLSLFYIQEYQKIRNKNEFPLYDISFIGTYNSDRYEKLIEFENFCVNNELRFKYHLYMPFLQYLKYFFINKKFLKRISLNTLSEYEVLNLVSQSKGILDLPSLNQQGITIRSIEALAAGKKLITTSKSIMNEKFYSENYILNYNTFQKKINFLNSPCITEISNLNSLNMWLNLIFK